MGIIKNNDGLCFIFVSAKIGKDGKPDPCRPIIKTEWKTVRNGYVVLLEIFIYLNRIYSFNSDLDLHFKAIGGHLGSFVWGCIS